MQNKFVHLSFLMFCVFFSINVQAIKSYSFITEEPTLVVYPNQYQNPANKKKSRLIALAGEINKRSANEIVEFVRISLTEMVLVYQEESMRAKEQSIVQDEPSQRRKLIRWSQDALSFANEIALLEESISHYTNIKLFIEPHGELYILIGDRPVLVSSPVINEQKNLEERIIQSSCARLYCDMARLDEISGPQKRKIIVNAGWVLEKGKYIFRTRSGLNFVFQSVQNKSYKQLFCLKIARDLNLVASVLADISRSGIFIDWEFLYIKVIPGGNQHELIVNQFKDAVHLELESIQFLNDFPEVTIPWLKERIKKRKKEFYFHKTELLISELADYKKTSK